MRFLTQRWLRVAVPGAVVFGLSGCLGPNPGFFITTSAASATIFTVVNTFVGNLLGTGGG